MRGRLSSAHLIRFHCTGQDNSQPRRLKFAIDTKVVAAKRTRSSNGNAQYGFGGYLYAPLPSTAFRQRL
jgi:hypothetical protein